MSPSPDRRVHHNCVGVGVGPANLSLAALLDSHPQVSNLFVEQRARFGWHDGQQIPGASLQVSLFKDLVTLADPTNRFSFLSYLHDQGKIYHFINAQFDAVPRQEFRNYLEWASERNDNITFGEQVTAIDFDRTFVIRTDRRTLTADNVVLGVGSRPWLPFAGDDGAARTQYHVSEFMHRSADLGGRRVTVVGGGQSGAEAVLDLISRAGTARPRQVSWISRRRNFFPIDDSPFTNDYFMPCYSDHFFELGQDVRERFNADQVLASDGISLSTLRAIYQQCYLNRFVRGDHEFVGLYPHRDVVGVRRNTGSGWTVATEFDGRRGATDHIETDVIVWATGFRPAALDLLAPIADRIDWEGSEPRIDQDFAVRWDGPPEHNLFVQNGARAQRGLADPNLSLVAWRSRRILDRMLGVKTDEQFPSFLSWPSAVAVDDLLVGDRG